MAGFPVRVTIAYYGVMIPSSPRHLADLPRPILERIARMGMDRDKTVERWGWAIGGDPQELLRADQGYELLRVDGYDVLVRVWPRQRDALSLRHVYTSPDGEHMTAVLADSSASDEGQTVVIIARRIGDIYVCVAWHESYETF
jgi:hypothetical protein